jgi:hypothetical protein
MSLRHPGKLPMIDNGSAKLIKQKPLHKLLIINKYFDEFKSCTNKMQENQPLGAAQRQIE